MRFHVNFYSLYTAIPINARNFLPIVIPTDYFFSSW